MDELKFYRCESWRTCGNDRCGDDHRKPHETGINCTEEICDYDEKSKCLLVECNNCFHPQHDRDSGLCKETCCHDMSEHKDSEEK